LGKKLTSSENTLDKNFKRYIRARDTQNGYGFCCTCGTGLKYEGSHAGHFLSCEYPATRWDERNCHLQCAKCNTFQSGRQHEHGIYVDRVHGRGTTDLLLFKSKAPCKWTNDEILAMSKKYREKYNELKKVKR